MPIGRRRYGPILGQILRGKGPNVPVKARGMSVRQEQLQMRRPSPEELGTGSTRLSRVTTTTRRQTWLADPRPGNRRRRVVRAR